MIFLFVNEVLIIIFIFLIPIRYEIKNKKKMLLWIWFLGLSWSQDHVSGSTQAIKHLMNTEDIVPVPKGI